MKNTETRNDPKHETSPTAGPDMKPGISLHAGMYGWGPLLFLFSCHKAVPAFRIPGVYGVNLEMRSVGAGN
jgi:hypothetical protein